MKQEIESAKAKLEKKKIIESVAEIKRADEIEGSVMYALYKFLKSMEQ